MNSNNNFKKYYVLIGLLIISFLSCNKDQISDNNSNKNRKLKPRSDAYIFEDGIMKFTSIEDFQATLADIQGMDESELEEWREEVTINTPAKAYQAFEEATSYNSDTLAYPATLVAGYSGLLVEVEENDTITVQKYRLLFDEFINADHIFMIEDDVFKVTQNSVITIQDGLNEDYESMDEETETDTTIGVIVGRISAPCCPIANYVENKWSTYRLSLSYDVGLIVIARYDVNGNYDGYFDLVVLNVEGKKSRRQSFWFIKWWGPSYSNATLLVDYHITIDWYNTNSDVNYTETDWVKNGTNVSKLSYSKSWISPIYESVIHLPVEVCLDYIDPFKYSDTSNSKYVEYQCL